MIFFSYPLKVLFKIRSDPIRSWVKVFFSSSSDSKSKKSTATPKRKKKDDDEAGTEDETGSGKPLDKSEEGKLQARFSRAVSELQFLGFIRPSKRKTDHVEKLTS